VHGHIWTRAVSEDYARGLADYAQVPPAAQCRAFGGDQTAPDARAPAKSLIMWS
jgi:hypothetical protein